MSLVLDFIKKALPTIGAVGGGIVGEAIDPFGGGIVGAGVGSALGKAAENKATGQSIGSGVVGAGLGGAVGQGVGGVASSFLGGLAPELSNATGIAGKALSGAVKGAGVGGAASTASAVASGQPITGKNLTMDFLQGAEQGGLTGGLIGGGMEAYNSRTPLNEVGSLNPGQPSDRLTPEQLTTLAKSNDQKKIAKELEPLTGPAVAQKIAPAIATTDDPNIVKNQVDNALNQHLTPDTTGAEAQSPAPTPLPPSTPVSNVTTPQQVEGQATAAEASYTPEQQSLDATAQTLPKSFLNAPGDEPQTTHVGELGAVTGMHDILNEGGSTDEALNHYMDTTGASYGDAQTALSKLIQDSGADGSLDRSKINAKLNPQYEKVSFPEAQAGDADRPVLNAQAAQKQVGRLADDTIGKMQQLSPQDLELVRQLKGNDPSTVISQAEDKVQFKKVVDALKTYNDYNQAAGANLGQDIPYRQNYGLRTPYEQPETDNQPGTASLPTNAGYTKGRVYNTHQEALDNGAVPVHENAIQDLAADASQRARDQGRLALSKGLNEAYPGQVKEGQIGLGDNGVYHQLLIPGGDRISLPADIADRINARQPYNETNPNWQKYDNLNAAAKNLKLGGGAFHGVTTLSSYVGQQLTSGQVFKDPGAVTDALKATFSPTAYNSAVSDWGESGHLRFFDQSGLTYKQPEVAADVEAKGGLGNIPVLKQIHEAIFGREIPFMKMRTMSQWMADNNVDPLNPTPEQLQEGTKIAKTLNNDLGGQNQAIQGLTPKQYQVASRLFLSSDYTTGQLATLRDALTKGGADGNLAKQIVFGKALLLGGLATAGGAVGGEFKDQTPKQVAIDILHKAVNPSFTVGGYKVGLPASQISLVEKPIEQTIQGHQNGNNLEGLQNFANSRLAAIPSEATQLASDKNYQGQAIYGTDSHGRPISPGTSAADIASTALPIPAANTVKTATGSESPLAAIANTVGLNVTPQSSDSNLPVGQQTYLEQLKTSGANQQTVKDTSTLFAALKKQTKTNASASEEINQDLAKGDIQAAQQVAQDYNQQLIAQLKPLIQKNPQILTKQVASQLQPAVIDLSSASVTSRLKSILSNPHKYGIKTPALTQ